MKFDKPENENYCATVVKLKAILPLENCDNVVATPLFGYQAIISKDSQVGDIGIVFPAETQLSEEFCRENNLYRHAELNHEKDKNGYIEGNRRIKAVKFRGHPSNALFMPLESLKYLKIKVEELNEGDEFDKIDGHEICQKYLIKRFVRNNHQSQAKKFTRVDTKHIPEHLDSDNYFKFAESVGIETEIIVTQKLHGTSIRVGNTFVKRRPTIIDRVAKLLGAKIVDMEFDYIFGSRKVIKDVNNPNQNHYYDTDIWTQEGKKLEGILPENYLVYGELIGWTETGAAIQKDYTYDLPEGTCQLCVYRVALVNSQGIITDLSWDHVKEFCVSTGLHYVPELWRGPHKDFDVRKFLDVKFNPGYKNALGLGSNELVDEGICVRVDRITPYILKAKSPIFLEHESKMLDTGEIDMETEGSEVIE